MSFIGVLIEITANVRYLLLTVGLEELVFEIRPARTAAKFIKSSLLLMSPNL